MNIRNTTPDWRLLLSLVIILQGFSVFMVSNKLNWFFGLSLFLIGSFMAFIIIRNRKDSVDNRLVLPPIMETITFKGLLIPWFPLIGLVIILFDLFLNLWIFQSDILGQYDTMVIIGGLSWIAYVYVPGKYSFERDFGFLFINITSAMFVAPLLVYDILIPSGGGFFAEPKLVNFFLARPLMLLLTLLNYNVTVNGVTLSYEDLEAGRTMYVNIATQCSGIFSVMIFMSGFFSYVLLSSRLMEIETLLFLFNGFMTCYIANLIRMAFIIIVGHYYGIDALLFAHENAGWLIFAFWNFIFWLLLMKYMPLDNRRMDLEDINIRQ